MIDVLYLELDPAYLSTTHTPGAAIIQSDLLFLCYIVALCIPLLCLFAKIC